MVESTHAYDTDGNTPNTPNVQIRFYRLMVVSSTTLRISSTQQSNFNMYQHLTFSKYHHFYVANFFPDNFQ